jgi:pilus assembly protein CpaE
MPTVVVAESNDTNATQLQSAVGSIPDATVVRVRSLEDAARAVHDTPAEGLLVGPSLLGDGAFELVASIRDDAKGGVGVVVVASAPDTDTLRRAMRAGVSDVVPVGGALSEISQAMQSALEVAAASRDAVQSVDSTVSTKGRVITVFSTKGGVGKSVLATNLATSLARDHKKRVVLMDLDLQFGDVGIMLGLRPDHTIYDAVQSYDRLDASMVSGLLMDHNSGARVLLAPTHPEDAEAVTPSRIVGILDILLEMADYVVIDTAPAFSDVTLTILDHSDVVYVVTMMDLASIKNTRVSLQKLEQLGFDSSRLRLVLNRADSKVLLEPSEVEGTIGQVTGRIPSDLLVPRSVNKGVPVVIDAPRSKVARSISALATDALSQLEGGGANHVA